MNKIKEIRLNKKMRVTDVPAKLGDSRITIWNYENDKRKPSLEMLVKIANVYGVSILDFIQE